MHHAEVELVDCERQQPVTLRALLNPNLGKYTLFILLRFFG